MVGSVTGTTATGVHGFPPALTSFVGRAAAMLPNETGHEQVAQTAAGSWTKDEVITAIRNLEAPYEEVGGWRRAMQIIGPVGG